MADTASAPAASKAEAGEAKQQFVRPEKPDETAYKDQLYKLEKTHSDAQAKFVSQLQIRHCTRSLALEHCMMQPPATDCCSLEGATCSQRAS